MDKDIVLSVVGWRVWYDDEVYDSRYHTWEEIPTDGVQVMYVYKSDGRRMHMAGYSSYFKLDGPNGEVYGSNMDEPDVTAERYPGAWIKRGKWTSLEHLERLQKEAAEFDWFHDN